MTPLSVALIWGVNVPVMKAVLGSITPFVFNALRLTLSALVLGVADRIESRGHAATPIPWRSVVGLAALTSLAYQALFITGIARTSAGHTGFLVASGPLWTALIARASGVEFPSPRAWFGLALAFFGTALVVSSTAGNQAATLLGNILLLFAMIAWAWGTVWSRSVLERFPATRLALLTTIVALPGHWIIASPEIDTLLSVDLSGATWAAVVFSGVFSTGIAYVLWNSSVRHLGPSRTAAYTNLVPVCALVVALIFLGERPTFVQLLGGALILIGLAAGRKRPAGTGM